MTMLQPESIPGFDLKSADHHAALQFLRRAEGGADEAHIARATANWAAWSDWVRDNQTALRNPLGDLGGGPPPVSLIKRAAQRYKRKKP